MTYSDLQDEIRNITALLFAHPNKQDDRATEIWIKFRNKGYYIFIDFEQPFPKNLEKQKLVGAGNALNCSDYKKDEELIQYSKKDVVVEILNKSCNFRGNLNEPITQVRALFDSFLDRNLYN